MKNLSHYLTQKIRFVKIEGEDTPTGYIDDILLHFNHYHTEEEAAEKWYRRANRVNWKHLLIIGMEQNLCTIDEIKSFDALPFENAYIENIKNITAKIVVQTKEWIILFLNESN